MGRTNVVVDEELIERARRLYRLRTKREVIDFALRRLVGEPTYDSKRILELEGVGWEGDVEEMRRTRFPEL